MTDPELLDALHAALADQARGAILRQHAANDPTVFLGNLTRHGLAVQRAEEAEAAKADITYMLLEKYPVESDHPLPALTDWYYEYRLYGEPFPTLEEATGCWYKLVDERDEAGRYELDVPGELIAVLHGGKVVAVTEPGLGDVAERINSRGSDPEATSGDV